MKIINVLLLTILISANTLALSVTEEVRTIGKASRITLDSDVLKEQRTLQVHLPDSYRKSNKRYPVLYLLDGERHFNHAILAVQLLQQQERIPELIIVAVTNTQSWGSDNNSRQRDFGQHPERFTRYLSNEVMSYVDKKYRTSGLNTLFGHSLAGYFAAELLATQPDLFKNYIAASPVLQGSEVAIYQRILKNTQNKNTPEKSFYFTLASGDEARRKSVTDALNNFVALLTQQSPAQLNWHFEFFDNQTHSSIYFPTLFPGLSYVFNSFQAPHFVDVQQYRDFGGMKGLEEHYRKRAGDYGLDNSIPKETLLNLAKMLLNHNKMEQALPIYLAVSNKFPTSAAAFSGLEQVYGSMKLYDQSVKAHQTAVKLGAQGSPEWQRKNVSASIGKRSTPIEAIHVKQGNRYLLV